MMRGSFRADGLLRTMGRFALWIAPFEMTLRHGKFSQQFGPTKARMLFVDHHLAHAISAYAYSGFEDAAVVVMDGRGAWEATTIWQGHNGRLDPVLMIPFPDSLGHFYSEFTEFLG